MFKNLLKLLTFFVVLSIFVSGYTVYAELKFAGCWFETTTEKLLIEFTESNGYSAVFVDGKGKVFSQVYGKEFSIVYSEGDTLEIVNSKNISERYIFVIDPRHIKKGCNCSVCKKRKKNN